MKQKFVWNHDMQDGIFFLLLGGALLGYGLDAHHKAFVKDWSQSPYLFPVLVSLIMGALALSLMMRAYQVSGQENAKEKKHTVQVLLILGMSLLYYMALAVLKIPYITFGIFSWSLTISNFEVITEVFLVVMMLYLGVRKAAVLVFVPLGTTLFLSVAFRAMLHVLLP